MEGLSEKRKGNRRGEKFWWGGEMVVKGGRVQRRYQTIRCKYAVHIGTAQVPEGLLAATRAVLRGMAPFYGGVDWQNPAKGKSRYRSR